MRSVLDFLTSTRVELAKVVWPTPNQTVKLTMIVIMVTILVGFFVGGVDFLLAKSLEAIINR